MTYHQPTNLDDALRVLAHAPVRVLAGGTDIYPAAGARCLAGDILDITAIDALRGIEKTKQGWWIGATTTWTTLATASLPAAFIALQEAAREVGSIQIQNSATVAGNICNASPAADGIPAFLVLDAEVIIESTQGSRRVPLSDFIQGVRKINLEKQELVTGVFIPDSAIKGVSCFEKLGARKYLVISICMVAVRLQVLDGIIQSAAISIGSCSPVATRLPKFEAALVGLRPSDTQVWAKQLQQEITNSLSAIDDIRADAPYRRKAAYELTLRAIKRAASEMCDG